MANARFLYHNLADGGELFAEQALADLPVENLRSTGLGEVWRTPPGVTSVYLIVRPGGVADVDWVQLEGTNLTAAATVRVRVAAGAAAGDPYDLHPGTVVNAGVDPVYKRLVYPLPEAYGAGKVRIDLDDPSVPYIEAGRLVYGQSFGLGINFSVGWRMLYADPSTSTQTIGGNLVIRSRPTRRGQRLTFTGLSEEAALDSLERLMKVAGLRKDVMVCRDPESPKLGRDTMWGVLGAPIDTSHLAYRYYASEIEQWERLV